MSLNLYTDIDLTEQGTHFLWWEYDDGTEAGVLIDRDEEREIAAKIFPSQEQRKAFQQRQKSNYKSRQEKFEKFALYLQCGLKTMKPKKEPSSKKQKAIATEGKENLFKLLEACGQETEARAEVMQLFSALLAAYYFHSLLKINVFFSDRPVKLLRAPILICNAQDAANQLLNDIVSSVALDTTGPSHKKVYPAFRYCQPCCLPQLLFHSKIIDSAYMELCKSKTDCFPSRYPAQYRDTGVFLNARFFPDKDLLQFQRRNQWATIVLSSAKSGNVLGESIRLDKKILENYAYNEGWDPASVQKLILYFVSWLKDRSKKRKKRASLISGFESLINKHNRQHGSIKVRGLKKLWLETQLLALEEFSSFGRKFGCWTVEEGSDLLAQWKNLLLPGCVPYSKPLGPLSAPGREIAPQQDCVLLFQQVLVSMLQPDCWKHFVYVPPKSDFPAEQDDVEVWGYIRGYQDRSSHQSILTLLLRESQLRKLAGQFSPATCDWYEIIKYFRLAAPCYLHPAKTMRMPGIRTLEPALVLKADQLDFLPQEANSFILYRYLYS